MYIYQVERYLLKAEIAAVAKNISGRVLDVGSGGPSRYYKMLGEVSEYVTLDINPEVRPDLIGSATAMPIPSGTFDSIICTQVLGDILFPGEAVAEFNRVLRSGGKVLVTEGFLNEIHNPPHDYWRFTPYALAELFEKGGFEVTSVAMYGGILTVILQLKQRFLINAFHLYEHPRVGRLFSFLFAATGYLSMNLERLFPFFKKRAGLGVVLIAQKK